MITLRVRPHDAGDRLDRWLSVELPDTSRSRLQTLIKDGHVTVDGKAVKPHQKVQANAEICVTFPEAAPLAALPEAIPLAILHEDKDIIVINKPAGMVVHPAAGHASGTLVNALLHHCQDLAGIGGVLRPGIVHRLDKDTSGALVVAKNEPAMKSLTAQFKNRRVHKEYLAIVVGTLQPPEGSIETLLGRSSHDRKKMAVRTRSGRVASTSYQTLEVFPHASLLQITIETGRTHQIRVHMSHLGHPVVGDAVYGRHRAARLMPAPAERQMLHAAKIAFTHPTGGKVVEFKAELPPDMRQLLQALRSEPPVSWD